MRIFGISLVLLFLIGCKSDSIFHDTVNEALIIAIDNYKSNARFLMSDFQEKALDPATSEKAKQYLPIVSAINDEAKRMDAFLDSLLSAKQKFNTENSNMLFDRMHKFRNNMLRADNRINSEFRNNFYLIGKAPDSLIRNETELYEYFTGQDGTIQRTVLLNIIKSNVWHFTSKVLYFLRTQVHYYIPHYYPGPVIGCNTTAIQSGDTITLFAGVGHFDWNNQVVVEVGGRTLKKNDNGLVEYKFSPKGKVGKYSLPVKISYHDEDGKQQIFETKVEYKIVR